MADATQVKRRRGTDTQCESMTPAEAEVIVDMTNDTLRVGDGLRAGGFLMPNFNHIQRQSFAYAVAGGTGNAITLTLSPALLAYADGVALEFKASNNNTGAATINVNGLGAKNIKKLSGGVLTDVASGDIVAGVVYRVTYDGTQFQVTNAEFTPPAPTGGLVKISTTAINSSSGVSISIPSGYTSVRFDLTDFRVSSGVNPVSFSTNSSINIFSSQVPTASTQGSSGFIEFSFSSYGFSFFGVFYGVSDPAITFYGGSRLVTLSSLVITPGSGTVTGTATLYGRN